VYQILLADPFRVAHAEIGELTDDQIWELYIHPELERAKKNRPRGEGAEEEEPEKKGRSRLPTRDEYIAGGLALGGNAEDLGKAYDQWAASKEGKRLTRGRKS
jgi:hypothetical protein